MPVITIFSGDFCKGASVTRDLLDRTGYRLITHDNLVTLASKISGMAENKIERAFSSKISMFDKFTREKERTLISLRLAMAEILSGDDIIIIGFGGHLVPREVSHVLNVCLIGDMKFRISVASEEQGLSEKAAAKLICKLDNDRAFWTDMLHGTKDSWDPDLYDIVIPMDKKSVEEAAALIEESVNTRMLRPSDVSKTAVEDFHLTAAVKMALAREGHDADTEVTARNSTVTLTINKKVLRFRHLEAELKSVVEKVSGVESVETRIGKDYHQSDIYRKHDFELPSRLLLVDDEREFVETLSERLMMRSMGSAVAYDGESALDLIREDEPEVMVLDLKMPGIDGLEVLRRVKETRPEIEVIILTGHGSAADKEVCLKLGAFAYLHKPVDIEVLSDTLKKANEKIRQKNRG